MDWKLQRRLFEYRYIQVTFHFFYQNCYGFTIIWSLKILRFDNRYFKMTQNRVFCGLHGFFRQMEHHPRWNTSELTCVFSFLFLQKKHPAWNTSQLSDFTSTEEKKHLYIPFLLVNFKSNTVRMAAGTLDSLGFSTHWNSERFPLYSSGLWFV